MANVYRVLIAMLLGILIGVYSGHLIIFPFLNAMCVEVK